MRKAGKAVTMAMAMLWLAGCTAMMIGGGNGGGYQPPKDQCEEGDTDCKSR